MISLEMMNDDDYCVDDDSPAAHQGLFYNEDTRTIVINRVMTESALR